MKKFELPEMTISMFDEVTVMGDSAPAATVAESALNNQGIDTKNITTITF